MQIKTLKLRTNLFRHIANEHFGGMMCTSAHDDFRVVSVIAFQCGGEVTVAIYPLPQVYTLQCLLSS